jgi:murein DD-endopeptidase MepM/ murein hydrolase activator NlpD
VRGLSLVASLVLLGGCARAFASTGTSSDAGPPTMREAPADTVDVGVRTADSRSPAPALDASPPTVIAGDAGTRSPVLRGGALRSPMPGGYLGGWNGDTGLDIAGNRLDVFAIAAGTLDYSEWGHTLWTRGRDTPYSVRLALDEPIAWGVHRVTHVYYTHLSKVETEQAEGETTRKHVEAGERIGVSGIGNGVPHLHLGLLLDNQVEQDSWTFILREGDIRKVMGGYRNGELLPRR